MVKTEPKMSFDGFAETIYPLAYRGRSRSRSTLSSSASSRKSEATLSPITSPEAEDEVKIEEDVMPRLRKRTATQSPTAARPRKAPKPKKALRSAAPSLVPAKVKQRDDSSSGDDNDEDPDDGPEPEDHWWQRPAVMDGHNLFNINTIEAAPFIVPETSDHEATLKRMLARAPGGFKRSDIKGPPVSTFWNDDSGTRPAEFAVPRMAIVEEGNMACREAGKAVVLLTGVINRERQQGYRAARYALWVRNKRKPGVAGETWYPYGVYRAVWNGPALNGEFRALVDVPKAPRERLTPQRRVARSHYEYIENPSGYSDEIFKTLRFQPDAADPTKTRKGVSRYELKDPTGKKGKELYKNETPEERQARWDRQKALRLQVQRAALKALKRNRGLAVGYSVYVYDGPITDAELDAAVAERAIRRSDPDAYKESQKLKRDAKTQIHEVKRILAKQGPDLDDAISAKYGPPPPMQTHRIPEPHDVFRFARVAIDALTSDSDSEADEDRQTDPDAESAAEGEGGGTEDDEDDYDGSVIILD